MFDVFLFLLFPFLGSLKSESYPDKLSTEDEEKYLLEFKMGDANARSKLIEHNLRLVAHIVKKYETTNEEKDDLLSIGIIGLIKGVDTYNHSATNKLGTYAARCIENEILMHIRSNKNKRNFSSLDSSIGLDKDGNDIKLLDIVKDDSKEILDTLILDESVKKLNKALKLLTEREYDIISRRYGLANKSSQTQKEIAKEMNISRSYVSRIEKRALMKLYLELLEDD